MDFGGEAPKPEDEKDYTGKPVVIATLLWDANIHSLHYSRMYDESWVEKLYRGVARHITRPFSFVCFTDKEREFKEPIVQMMIDGEPNYASCIQPYKLNVPMILMGLDTIITGSIDELADYCFYGDRLAVPRDPFYPEKVCNGVALVPGGMKERMYDAFDGRNDMEWVRAQQVDVIDKLFPGQVQSYKGHVERNGLGDTRIVYFHGERKPPELAHVGWIERHWI